MRYLVVDGHSVIFQWPHLRALHQSRPARARLQLQQQLAQLHETSDWRVTLVFDGKAGGNDPAPSPGMVVLFSHADQTADSIIERLVAQAPPKARILVITADEAEKLTVETLGAETASPQWLADEMTASQTRFQDTLRQIRKDARWKT